MLARMSPQVQFVRKKINLAIKSNIKSLSKLMIEIRGQQFQVLRLGFRDRQILNLTVREGILDKNLKEDPKISPVSLD